MWLRRSVQPKAESDIPPASQTMVHVGLRCANPTCGSVDPYPVRGCNLYPFVVSAPVPALSESPMRCDVLPCRPGLAISVTANSETARARPGPVSKSTGTRPSRLPARRRARGWPPRDCEHVRRAGSGWPAVGRLSRRAIRTPSVYGGNPNGPTRSVGGDERVGQRNGWSFAARAHEPHDRGNGLMSGQFLRGHDDARLTCIADANRLYS